MFNPETVAYLNALPAVRRASAERISYEDWFRREATERLARGDGPAAIFRDRGLGSDIIGYKRIERACARWRETPEPPRPAPKPSGDELRDRLIREQLTCIEELRERVRALEEENRRLRLMSGETIADDMPTVILAPSQRHAA